MPRKYDPQALRMPIATDKGFLGTRTSLRLGRKWADRLERGEQAVVLLNATGGPRGTAIATRAAYLHLRDVPRAWLAIDVDPLMKHYPEATLSALYPDETVTQDSLVSVVWLTRTR